MEMKRAHEKPRKKPSTVTGILENKGSDTPSSSTSSKHTLKRKITSPCLTADRESHFSKDQI